MKQWISPAIAAAVVLGLTPMTAPSAQAATIKAASCFPKGSFFSRRFESVIKDLKAAGLDINYVGGAPAIGSPFTLVQKMTRGAFDMVNCTGAYYGNVLPEGDALKMLETTPAESRKDGSFDYIAKLHNAKNMTYVARLHSGEKFHLYLAEGKAISKPDLKGLHLRAVPIYRALFESLGATTQRSNLAQIYTYMENGTVAGYGWPVTGLLPDWHKVTKYRVDPGFYDADIHLLVNAKTYAKMSAADKKTLNKIAIGWETKGASIAKVKTAAALKKQLAQGIKPINFSKEDTAKWSKQAVDAGWASIIKASPKHGAELRRLMSK